MKKKEELNTLVKTQTSRNEQMRLLADILVTTLEDHKDLLSTIQSKIQNTFSDEIEENMPRKKQRTEQPFESVFQYAF